MKFIELTRAQGVSCPSDPGIAIAAEHIMTLGVFRYNTGDTVTEITLVDGRKVEVTESFRDVLNMLRNFR